MRGEGGRVFRNNYKGHMAKTKEGWNEGVESGEGGGDGWGRGSGGRAEKANNCT